MINTADFVKQLKLEVLVPTERTELEINNADINRPGMQFTGFYEYFAYKRLQVMGKVDMAYLETLDPVTLTQVLEKYMSYPIPCIVLCWGMTPPPELLTIAKAHDVPVFRSHEHTTRFGVQAETYLNQIMAPRVTRHGVLVDVYDIGVLITGESGVGKSEAALELIKRGHQLCADDVVDICRVSEDLLVGESPEMIRHFMEIRGIGIIDVRAMYGVGSVVLKKTIDMVIHLEHWKPEREYDRFGLTEETTNILGVKVPYQIMPVRPGRNLAVIIEVAARNLSLKRMGYSAAQELDNRLNALVRGSEK